MGRISWTVYPANVLCLMAGMATTPMEFVASKWGGDLAVAFIVFEGLDASGKSTLIDRVRAWLQEQQIPSVLLRDPGSTPVGERIRNLVLDPKEKPGARTETLLYEAARAEMVEKTILPALDEGKWVLCDRFYSSTVAFQGFARGLDMRKIESLNDFAIHPCKPDLFVFLDISVEESEKRKLKRAKQLGMSLLQEQNQQKEPVKQDEIHSETNEQKTQEHTNKTTEATQSTGQPFHPRPMYLEDRMEGEKGEFQQKVRQGYLYQLEKDPDRWLSLDGTLTPQELLDKTLQGFVDRGLLS